MRSQKKLAPEEELRGLGGRATVAEEELVASRLAVAVSASDAAFSGELPQGSGVRVRDFERENESPREIGREREKGRGL